MRFLLTLPLLAALALPLTGCFDRDDRDKKGHGHCGDAAPSNITDLTRGEWFSAGSTSNSTTEIFRPQLESPRGGHKYLFTANGDYLFRSFYCIPPGINTPGTWTLKGKTLTLYPTGGAAEVRQIVSISATELQLAR